MPHPEALTPRDIEAIATGLLRLSQQIDRSGRPEDIADVLTPIVDRHDGAIRRLTQIFEAIGDTCNDFILQDPYAEDLQGISDEASDTLRALGNHVNGLDEQFRTFSSDVTRTPSGQRPPAAAESTAPPLAAKDSIPEPVADALTPDRVRLATRTLADLAAYLRTGPSLADTLPLLVSVLHETDGIPVVLGDILRASARIVTEQATLPLSEESRQAVGAFREAAQDVTDWHVLHWDVQRLYDQFSARPADTPGP
ncbi:hypothetical protein [Streptomyces sp. 769]|uniref:hypothetical protein n=1 Tax=Streptomyces sp. 769 TaxID=1262452 RepID=UPI000581E9C4|nr:hypothetical protein [Streptomyces sp. 769]AJC55079.1 hypothetical protein GZL_02488 [Streptomyces sp. 769]